MRRGRHGDGRRRARALRRRAPARRTAASGRRATRASAANMARAFAVPLAGEGAALAVLAPALLVLLGVAPADYVATLADAGVGGAAAAPRPRRAPRGALPRARRGTLS